MVDRSNFFFDFGVICCEFVFFRFPFTVELTYKQLTCLVTSFSRTLTVEKMHIEPLYKRDRLT